MFRLISNKLKNTLILICLIYFSIANLSCSNKNESTKKPSPSEIISYFIKNSTGDTIVTGDYLIISGLVCKACVHQTLLSLDSVIEENHKWKFITSHKFVLNYSFKNIEFIYDVNWRNINFELVDVSFFRMQNDSITESIIPFNISNVTNLKCSAQ